MSYPTVSYSAQPGLSASSTEDRLDYTAAAFAAVDADQTLTSAQLLTGGLVCGAFTTDRVVTLPTAALLVSATSGFVGTSLEFYVVANSGDDCTIAAGTGGSTLGNMVVSGGSSGQFSVRLTNVSSGSEAYVVARLA